MRILGIETSCDETAAAVVSDDKRIFAERLRSQLEDHAPFGGVVPEVAARAHIDILDHLIAETMAEAELDFSDLDAVAATAGPGLIGGVLVGMMTAKAIAAAAGVPFLAINHLEAHALTARLTNALDFPYLLLLVSGGHTQILIVEDVGRYQRLGTTVDDALGECFDKAAMMMDLGYPGGPALESAATGGDETRFSLPRPMLGRPGCQFSFSGLKTAVKHALHALPEGALSERDRADMCASFQAAVGEALTDRIRNAVAVFQDRHDVPPALVVAGGVAANRYLRERIGALADEMSVDLVAPPMKLCTDNGVMIAWAGIERLRLGLVDGLDTPARPRWPLDPEASAGG
jgi:N6-L-threonylcarbamoyladenine synthase